MILCGGYSTFVVITARYVFDVITTANTSFESQSVVDTVHFNAIKLALRRRSILSYVVMVIEAAFIVPAMTMPTSEHRD